MNSAFEKLTEEKRQHIISICIEEFSENGYKGASTDVITERLNISKGILYYYFGNKENLYLYVMRISMDKITENMIENMKKVRAVDFFDRIKEIILAKFKSNIENPHENQLLIRGFSEIPPNLKEDIMKIKHKQVEINQNLIIDYLFSYLNTSRIRQEISIKHVMEFTTIILDYLGEKCVLEYKGREYQLLENPEEFYKEMDIYLDMIKNGIFKTKKVYL